jgi:hypothetical protein
MFNKNSTPRVVACDEHPKKITVAQAVNPRSDAPSDHSETTLDTDLAFKYNDSRLIGFSSIW